MSNSLLERRERDVACIGVRQAIKGRYCGKLVMEPCQIFQYRYQNIDIYDKTTMLFVSPNFDFSYAELPRCPISSSPAAAAAFPGSDIRAFIGPFTIGSLYWLLKCRQM